MNLWGVIKMLQYERTDVSEGIDVNKPNKLKKKKSMNCHYWHFKDICYKLNHMFVVINAMI